MSVLDYLLDGLEAELTLERELGVRFVACDRALLGGKPRPAPPEPARIVSHEPRPAPPEPRIVNHEPRATPYDFVFLHHQPLAPEGVEMLSKIVTAMRRTPETAPLIVEPPRPKAKITIVLGGLALRKFFPDVTGGAPGQWLTAPSGEQLLVTYSPAYILRFKTITPAVDKYKHDMWASLKSVLQRLG